ncbi:hypothetical protein ABPG74_004833 [Tetrahymena malaccensis]
MKRKAIRRLNKSSNHIKKTNKKIRKLRNSTQVSNVEGWDKNKSQEENLKTLGIYKNINKRVTNIVDKNELIRLKKEGKLEPEFSQYIQVEEEVDLDDIKSILEKNKLPEEKYTKQKPGRINIDEEWAVEKIVAKYKTNFSKAYLDHKVNTFMWTEDQLQKKYNAYIEKHGKCPKN